MDVYRAGNITIANAPGTGICDDKAIYSYMPEIVEFYTGRKALLENVPTWRCSEADSLKYVLENLADLVVKEVHGSGGYGMLVGPTASKKERADFAEKLKARPDNYIAQPTLSLSTVPILVNKGIAPRHVDLRPYVLVSDKVQIIPGGLTRVALKARLAGGQFQPGRRHQRYLGSGGLMRMLGRTANGLYWMFRYIERAENIARLIDAGLRMSLTRSGDGEDDWDGVLQSAGVREAYDEVHDKLTSADAIDYLLRDRSNPSSVMSCIDYGRNNARMVRTALTRETWEATNECWIDLKTLLAKRVKAGRAARGRSTSSSGVPGLIRGAFHGTMLRNELYQLRPHRHLHRAGRQYGAHSRREILRAAAVGLAGRLLDRQCPVGIDPALGLGAPLLQLGL